MSALELCIEGIGFWAPGYPDWNAARAGLRDGTPADPAAPAKPSPAMLPPAERRRAPQPVLLACEVAAQACAASGHAPDSLASVFASTHGDLIITDYMCSTLASAPRELSPIRFHNSVHNAPAGYWTIAAHCHIASTSVSSWHASFATALFEAAVEACAENAPVLLVAYDTESTGPLLAVSPATSIFGVAMVVAPAAGRAPTLRLALRGEASEASLPVGLPSDLASLAAGNPMAAGALPLLFALAAGGKARLQLVAGLPGTLDVELDA
ncbi:MAG: beta-ketoacyl synthase chain length factor [Dokdonella sp.]|nr:beta-ketoacyl synthase chain length factor [Dokdonella sp.]